MGAHDAGFTNFLSVSELEDPAKGFLVDDKVHFKVRCILWVRGGKYEAVGVAGAMLFVGLPPVRPLGRIVGKEGLTGMGCDWREAV